MGARTQSQNSPVKTSPPAFLCGTAHKLASQTRAPQHSSDICEPSLSAMARVQDVHAPTSASLMCARTQFENPPARLHLLRFCVPQLLSWLLKLRAPNKNNLCELSLSFGDDEGVYRMVAGDPENACKTPACNIQYEMYGQCI